MIKHGLTETQAKALEYITRYIEGSGGIAPSYEDIMLAMGMASKGGIHRIVTQLEKRGHITRLANSAAVDCAGGVMTASVIVPQPKFSDPAYAGWIKNHYPAQVAALRCKPSDPPRDWFAKLAGVAGITRKRKRRFGDDDGVTHGWQV
ncbi:MAG: hypothetical protein U5N55_05040 [Cypionkella sp.]|nr:hypothetical protein [Cypionkella sp.]